MAGNISGIHQFANDVGPLPLKLLDDSFTTLSIALNTLSTFSNFSQDQGTTNAYTIQASQYQFVSYTDGLQVTVRIANTNTGASTLNVNGLGAMPILTSIGSELQPNALVAGAMVTFVYNAQRQAWQISSGGSGGGQITAPLHVTNPTGQAALSINVDGSGYLGDFNGNGLSWDGACNFTFEGGATLSGIKPDFRIDSLVSGYTNEPQLELRADGYSGITAWPSGTAVNLEANGGGALGTPPCQLEWDANCNWVFGGDSKVTIPNVALGTAPNQILIDSNGTLTTTGTATIPMPPLIDLPGINITNPQNGEALVYDQATNSWVNGAPVNALAALNDVTLTAPATGQTLTYNAVTQRWINSPPILALEGLTNTHISGPAPGQVLTYSLNPMPGWVNATIPGYNFLTNLGVGANPQPGWVLTWDGAAWVGASPGQVATFPLSSLTDVGITTPLNRQVLTYDAPSGKWINAPAASPSLSTLPDVHLTAQTQGQVLAWDNTLQRWVNSALPGGSVIALDTLMDVNVSDPQDNQVLTWDYASARWVNRALPPTFTPVFTNPAAGQFLTYNGTNWVNTAPPAGATLATLPDVTLTSASARQLLTYNGTHWVNGGNAIITADSVTTPALAVNCQAGSGPGVLVNVQPNGNGLQISGTGTSSNQYHFSVVNGNDYLCAIWSDGSGFLGPNSITNLNWNTGGNFVINAPSGGYALNVNGAGNFQGPQGWPLDLRNTQTAGVGNICALRMGVVNNYSGIEYCSIQAICENAGNAQIGLGLFTSPATPNAAAERIRISSDGAVTIHPCATGTPLTVNGTGPFWTTNIATVSTGYGLQVNAGHSSNEYALQIRMYDGTSLFAVRSDGATAISFLQPTSFAANCYADSGGWLARYTSSRRYKTNIRSVTREQVREVVRKLRLVKFNSLCPASDPKADHYGLIAEEVAEAEPALVVYDKEGNPDGVQYAVITALLLPLLQELLGMDEPEGEVYG